MSTKTRVLIADDSAVIRKLLADALAADSSLDVVKVARNGQEAVASYAELRPDIVLLDVEMPVMDGLEAVSQIRQFDRNVPIIMFSSLTAQGAATTLEALARGASDFVVKPSRLNHVDEAVAYVRREVISRIQMLRPRQRPLVVTNAPASKPVVLQPPNRGVVPAPKFEAGGQFDLVAIGASTGGPNALADVIRQLDPALSAPVLIVQHMPPVFTQLLAERLNGMTQLNVREATDGVVVTPGQVWIAPGNFHMALARRGTSLVLKLNQDAPVNSCRPAVDVLFQSVAKVIGRRTLAAVLTGMGRDGRDGAQAIRQAGGQIFAQDEETCVVYGMPRAIVEANLAHQVLPLGSIGAAINLACRKNRRHGAAVG